MEGKTPNGTSLDFRPIAGKLLDWCDGNLATGPSTDTKVVMNWTPVRDLLGGEEDFSSSPLLVGYKTTIYSMNRLG